MDGKKVPPPSRIPKKKSQPGEKKCTSGERPQVTGSDSVLSQVASCRVVAIQPLSDQGWLDSYVLSSMSFGVIGRVLLLYSGS